MIKTQVTMDDLLAQDDSRELAEGDVIEATVLRVLKKQAWLDLGPYGLGLVIRREMGRRSDIETGKTIHVSIIDPDSGEGFALVSVKKAAKDRGWDDLEKAFAENETIEIEAYDANRGGLLVELAGIRGFLPVSQLAAEHYPRVAGADKDEILQRLNSLTGIPLKVRILDLSKKENKLIFSEKEAVRDAMKNRFEKLTIGDTIKGTITGVVDFGAFVNVDGIEGLIHISEISWDRVEKPADYVKVGDEIEAKIIAIDQDRLSLSLKQTQEDPWLQEVADLKKGDEVEGKVVRITPFGAFIQIGSSVEALVHVSELAGKEKKTKKDQASGTDPEKIFQLNEAKKFTILDIDRENRKISLSLKS